MATLINRQGGSDCETFALGFKQFKLGPVIGTRTWGGWVGIRGDKALRDGGMITQPEFGGWDPKGTAMDHRRTRGRSGCRARSKPEGLIHGKDLQLDYAIDYLLKRSARIGGSSRPRRPSGRGRCRS